MSKRVIRVMIEMSEDYFFDAKAEDLPIFGAGETIDDCKMNVRNAIDEYRKSDKAPYWIKNGEYRLTFNISTK